MKRILSYIIAFSMLSLSVSCVDEQLEPDGYGRTEGEASLSVTLDFKPMATGLAQTRAAGDALKDVSSLYVLLYDYESKTLEDAWEIREYSEADIPRSDGEAENGMSAESETRQVKFNLGKKVLFGRYYMYAVANVENLLRDYSGNISTVDGLKSLPLGWDSSDISKNGQMMGCFTVTGQPSAGDESILLNRTQMNLHAWLRRAASKVTVAFDGRNLKEGVSIYLKSLRIKNLPLSCKLGADNTIDSKEGLLATGEELVYCESGNYDASYPALISSELPFYPRVQGDGGSGTWVMAPDAHSETNPNSLFFYENLQGEGPDKKQIDNNDDGILDELYEYGQMPYATYIEVNAYYESTNPAHPGICDITYRFMLGQDIRKNYDARRNCHYKLTLHFNGYADNPDWRIDYVTRLWTDQPETVDYRGKYFVPSYESGVYNYGNKFSGDNYITVTSFMYENDDWAGRKPQPYQIEYRDAGSDEFSETPPEWFSLGEPVNEGNGVSKLKINYKNPYKPVIINERFSENESGSDYDLSTKGGTTKRNTANCYIVDADGSYCFPLVYGNAITDGVKDTTSFTYQMGYSGEQFLERFKNYKDLPISAPYILDDIYGDAANAPELSAALVWQDAMNLIDTETVSYDAGAYGGKGGIRFEIGDVQEGNAVIALKDESGTIMWSWHIWVTALDFSWKVNLTNATKYGERNYEILPVNLGWCSGDIPVRYYDGHECEVRFTQLIGEERLKGLSKTVTVRQEPHVALPRGNNPYFQWGRKDPFVASGNGNKTNKTWYDAAGDSQNSAPEVMYSSDGDRVATNKATAALIRNPHKWQNGPRIKDGDTAFKPYNEKIFYNLWDNSCWDDNDDVVKTVYDPCPAGYHVSSLYTFTGFTDTGDAIYGNLENSMYGATEDNMMPADGEDTGYKHYRDGIFEFYTDRTKLHSIGFPMNGYRDWDDNANIWEYGKGEIWSAQSWSWVGEYNAYHFEFSRGIYNGDGSLAIPPLIRPWNNFYATDGMAVRPARTLPRNQ